MNNLNRMFSLYAKEQEEKRKGKMRRVAGHFMLNPNETRPTGTYPKGDSRDTIRVDFLGRKMCLTKGPAICCKNIELMKNDHAILTNSKTKEPSHCSVLVRVCRKCDNYIKTGRLRYATCKFLKEEDE